MGRRRKRKDNSKERIRESAFKRENKGDCKVGEGREKG
jgi:hypothetical protein